MFPNHLVKFSAQQNEEDGITRIPDLMVGVDIIS